MAPPARFEQGDVDAAAEIAASRSRNSQVMFATPPGSATPAAGCGSIERRFEERSADFLACGQDAEPCRRSRIRPIVPWRSQAALALQQLGRRTRRARSRDEELELSRTLGRAAHGRHLAARARPGRGWTSRRAAAARGGRGARGLAGAARACARARRSRRAAPARQQSQRGAEAAAPGSRPRSSLRRAAALVEAANDELAATGAHPRTILLSGLDALTASERRVAQMAAEELSNKEIAQALFVTVKTVEQHLGRVYRKLDISSRRQLGAALGASAETAPPA